MHGDGVEGIVDAHDQEEPVKEEEEGTGEGAYDDGGPGGEDVAAGAEGHRAWKKQVTDPLFERANVQHYP